MKVILQNYCKHFEKTKWYFRWNSTWPWSFILCWVSFQTTIWRYWLSTSIFYLISDQKMNWIEFIEGDWSHGTKTGVGKFYYSNGALRYYGNISEVESRAGMNITFMLLKPFFEWFYYFIVVFLKHYWNYLFKNFIFIPSLSVPFRAWHMALGLIFMKMEILCLKENGRRESFIMENYSL